MVYEYACRQCKETVDVVKSVAELNDAEYHDCGKRMERLFCFRGQMSFGTFQPGHYPAFGKTFTNAHQLENEKRRLKGEEGREVMEVGNDKSALKKLRPPKFKPDLERAAHELKTKKVMWDG